MGIIWALYMDYITEYQRYEQDVRLNISMPESLDTLLGSNLEQNKTFNFLRLNKI